MTNDLQDLQTNRLPDPDHTTRFPNTQTRLPDFLSYKPTLPIKSITNLNKQINTKYLIK